MKSIKAIIGLQIVFNIEQIAYLIVSFKWPIYEKMSSISNDKITALMTKQ